MGRKAWILAVLAGGLWACNNEAGTGSTDSDTDNTRMADSGATPGANTVVTDTLSPDTRAGIDSAQLDTLDRNENR